MRLDHVSYAVSHSELSDTVQRLGAQLGAAFRDGGRHPQFGTCNFILPLQNGVYLEVVAPLDHPATEQAPFGQAVKRRAEAGGGWLGWVVSVSDLASVETRLGRAAVAAHRRRADGYDLAWKQIGVTDQLADPQLPFFIKWMSPASEHPSAGASSVGLNSIDICGDEVSIREYIGYVGNSSADPLDGVQVNFVSADEPGIQAVSFNTPNGLVVID